MSSSSRGYTRASWPRRECTRSIMSDAHKPADDLGPRAWAREHFAVGGSTQRALKRVRAPRLASPSLAPTCPTERRDTGALTFDDLSTPTTSRTPEPRRMRQSESAKCRRYMDRYMSLFMTCTGPFTPRFARRASRRGVNSRSTH